MTLLREVAHLIAAGGRGQHAGRQPSVTVIPSASLRGHDMRVPRPASMSLVIDRARHPRRSLAQR